MSAVLLQSSSTSDRIGDVGSSSDEGHEAGSSSSISDHSGTDQRPEGMKDWLIRYVYVYSDDYSFIPCFPSTMQNLPQIFTKTECELLWNYLIICDIDDVNL